MGLVKAFLGAAGGTFADQWKEFLYCDSIPSDVLAMKGRKKISGRSSNRGSDNIITSGSVIAVNDGQCMMIVEQGKVVDVCAEPGEYTYDAATEPSLFCGDLGEGVANVFASIGKRFTFGGEAPRDQRVYFINTKELVGNKYGTPSPVPFRVVDANIGLDMDISIRCFGEYSYRITNPILFYTNVCGNVTHSYERGELDSQLKSELMTALQPAFAKLSEMGIRYSALPGHTIELANALNDVLSQRWSELRGIEIVSLGINSMKASEEDEKLIKELQRNAAFRNPNMAAAQLVGAQSQAMQAAAANKAAGSAMAFMGMNMAQGAGGADAESLFKMGQKAAANEQAHRVQERETWTCACGAVNKGKFCVECGKPKPQGEWTCSCGTVNKGKFCMECGSPRPSVKKYRCSKCGWQPENSSKPPKFCPECGDPINEADTY